jgi:hypothetical protein
MGSAEDVKQCQEVIAKLLAMSDAAGELRSASRRDMFLADLTTMPLARLREVESNMRWRLGILRFRNLRGFKSVGEIIRQSQKEEKKQ